MTINNAYATPSSELVGKEKKIANFSSLNFWRKFYIVLLWVCSIVIPVFFLSYASASSEISTEFWVGFSLVTFGVTYWHHYAIVKRKATQIIILAVLSFIPFGNPIGCLIMISVFRATKKELNEYDVIEAGD